MDGIQRGALNRGHSSGAIERGALNGEHSAGDSSAGGTPLQRGDGPKMPPPLATGLSVISTFSWGAKIFLYFSMPPDYEKLENNSTLYVVN